MFEETNQTAMQEDMGTVQDTNVELPDSLFGDDEPAVETTPDVPDTTEQRNESTKVEETSAEDAQKAGISPQTVKLKYNGEEKEISMEEAIQLAQKGMNYDHVKQELENYRNGKQSEVPIIAEYARASGMEYNAYLAMLEKNARGYAVEQEREQIQNQYPDADEDFINELAEARAKLKEQERRQTEDETRKAETDKRLKPWRDFSKRYPDVDAGALPEEVIHAIRDGATPIDAYQVHLIAQLEHEKQTAEQNALNKARAVGSAKGDAAEKEKDAFLAGFNS